MVTLAVKPILALPRCCFYFSKPLMTSPTDRPHFTRTLGLRSAIAVNMTQMCGIGPFVTIPLIVKAMGGPQAMFVFLIGAVIALADGLVWAELGAAMPGAGGTYLYLREAFQYRSGRLMPFLFIWTAMISIPLIMSTGVIGLVNYLSYYYAPIIRSADAAPVHGIMKYVAVTPLGAIISLAIVALVVVALYQRIGRIEKLANVFFLVMLMAVGAVVVASYTHFHPDLAFAFTNGAFSWPWKTAGEFYHATQNAATGSAPPPVGVMGVFYIGLGYGLVNAVYDYAGYNTAAYMGEELTDPGRVIPRSIVLSVLGMMSIYLVLQIGVLGVLPWEQIATSDSIGSIVLEHTWGRTAAHVFTAFIVVTAFASITMGLLGGSRVPYHAARDRLFFPIFGRLHERLNFPYIALLVMAAVMVIGSLFSLGEVISMLTAVMVLVQGISQIAALTVLRKRQPALRRPYRMWLYPLPSIIALLGWTFVYYSSGWMPIALSIGWLALGVVAFIIWAGSEGTWPFGPKEIREEFLEAQRGTRPVA